MPINRSWVRQFYQECGREVSLAYNVFNHTNSWGLTLTTGIVAVVFLTAIGINGSQVTFRYPNIAYWYAIIVAWIIMVRFYVRSCLALVNMYRWNTLIYAASKILSLPRGHASVPVFERNFAKKVKAYFYEWRSPIPRYKLVRECFKLIYIWFFMIIVGLIIWGAIALYDGQMLWIGGILLLLVPTAWEIYSFLTYRGFKFKSLDLEDEPDITNLWLDTEEKARPAEKTGEQTRNGFFRKYVVSQALIFFFFGLLSILAFFVSTYKTIPAIDYGNILGTMGNFLLWICNYLLVPIGLLAIAWSIVLFVVSFIWKIVERMEENKLQRYQIWSSIFYWPALVTVFGTSFANIWVSMVKGGVNELYLYIIYALAILVLFGLLIHHWRSPR